MAIETVRISAQGREQLSRLKRFTGIENWNVLCRWALCVSLAEETTPPAGAFKGETGVEIAWRVFGGRNHEVYLALLKQRCLREGLAANDDSILAEQLRLHIHRGLGYLVGNRKIQSISELMGLALK